MSKIPLVIIRRRIVGGAFKFTSFATAFVENSANSEIRYKGVSHYPVMTMAKQYLLIVLFLHGALAGLGSGNGKNTVHDAKMLVVRIVLIAFIVFFDCRIQCKIVIYSQGIFVWYVKLANNVF